MTFHDSVVFLTLTSALTTKAFFIDDSTISDNFGGGKFTLEGTDYQEIVEYHSAKQYLGQTVKLYLEINNDTLTQFWPVDENGVPDKDHHYMEKWVRFQ